MPDVVTNDELNALAAEYVLGTLDYEERKGASALLEVDHEFRGVVRVWERRLGELHLMVEPVEPDAALWERIKAKAAAAAQLTPPELLEVAPANADPAAAAAPDTATSGPQPSQATEAELKLAELAALLPAAADQISPSSSSQPEPAAPPLPPPPEDLDQKAAEEAPTVVIPPPPLLRRGVPATVAEAPAPAHRRGRGWMATALVTSLVAIVLACLIGAWRFFPERLPEQLRADTLLKLQPPQPPLESKAQPKPKPVPFDE